MSLSVSTQYNTKDDLCKQVPCNGVHTHPRALIHLNSTKINIAIIRSMIPLIAEFSQPSEWRANPNRLHFYCADIGTPSQINHKQNNKNKMMHMQLYFRYSIDVIP